MIHALDIPETREDRIAWLERQVTGIHLTELVAELRAVHQPVTTVTLRDLTGGSFDRVLEDGLASLDETQIQNLLQNPDSLFELQEQILIHGSTHWEQASEQSLPSIEFDASMMSVTSDAATGETVASRPVTRSQSPESAPVASGRSWITRPPFVSLVTAAVVLLAVNLSSNLQPGRDPDAPPAVAQTGWGWDRPGALPSDAAADEYLNGLAESAQEWFNKRPETAQGVAIRIAEFRQGCSTLILASHEPLSAEDHEWLVDRCRAWAEKLDGHLAAIEAGESVEGVLKEADDTVNALVKALQGRAQSVA